MSLGENIKELRKKLNISQEELGNRSGLSRNAIYNYENDKRTPDTDTLNRIAKALNVSPFKLAMDLFSTNDTYFKSELEKILDSSINKDSYHSEDDDNDEDEILFKSISYYKKNPLQYWLDVVLWCPIDELYGYDLNKLSDKQMSEIAKALELTLKFKIFELNEKKINK